MCVEFIHSIGEMLELTAGKSTKYANLIAWHERIGQSAAWFVNAVVGLGGLHKYG